MKQLRLILTTQKAKKKLRNKIEKKNLKTKQCEKSTEMADKQEIAK